MQTFNYHSVIIPKADANGMVALALRVEEVAAAFPGLEPRIAAAVEQVKGDRIAVQRVSGAAPDEKPVVKIADANVDNAWGVLRVTLEGWARMPDTFPEAALASDAEWQIFGKDGLSFLTLKVEEERAASETRLQIIEEKGLVAVFERLGLMPVYRHLKAAHEEYARVIHAAAKPSSSGSLRAAIAALHESLGMYATRVVATVERGKPETFERAEALLKPISDWRERHRASRGKTSAPPAVAVGDGGSRPA